MEGIQIAAVEGHRDSIPVYMEITRFPPAESANQDGLLAIGGDLEIPTIISAYERGIFPWPISESAPLAWFSPDPRGVIDFSDLHTPTKLKKIIKKKLLTSNTI